jgi:hypothetical protein
MVERLLGEYRMHLSKLADANQTGQPACPVSAVSRANKEGNGLGARGIPPFGPPSRHSNSTAQASAWALACDGSACRARRRPGMAAFGMIGSCPLQEITTKRDPKRLYSVC